MKKNRGCLFAGLFIAVILFLFIVTAIQYRHFYNVGNMTFTFWKTKKGCYIMPYKYYGITIPKNNYMKAANTGGTIIFIGEDSTMYIFPTHPYYQGADTIECNLSSYKYKYFPDINEYKYRGVIQDTIDYYTNYGYPYINIYIAEMYAQIGNSVNK